MYITQIIERNCMRKWLRLKMGKKNNYGQNNLMHELWIFCSLKL